MRLGGNDTVNGRRWQRRHQRRRGCRIRSTAATATTRYAAAPAPTAGTYRDDFSSQILCEQQRHAGLRWRLDRRRCGGSERATGGDIDIEGGRLRFNENVDGGEIIERAFNLAGATSAVVSFNYEDDNLGAGQSVTVQARNDTPMLGRR